MIVTIRYAPPTITHVVGSPQQSPILQDCNGGEFKVYTYQKVRTAVFARGQRRGQHVPCLEESTDLEHAMDRLNVTLMPQ